MTFQDIYGEGSGALRSSQENVLCKPLLQRVLAQCEATRAVLWFVIKGLFCGYQVAIRPGPWYLYCPSLRTEHSCGQGMSMYCGVCVCV